MCIVIMWILLSLYFCMVEASLYSISYLQSNEPLFFTFVVKNQTVKTMYFLSCKNFSLVTGSYSNDKFKQIHFHVLCTKEYLRNMHRELYWEYLHIFRLYAMLCNLFAVFYHHVTLPPSLSNKVSIALSFKKNGVISSIWSSIWSPAKRWPLCRGGWGVL